MQGCFQIRHSLIMSPFYSYSNEENKIQLCVIIRGGVLSLQKTSLPYKDKRKCHWNSGIGIHNIKVSRAVLYANIHGVVSTGRIRPRTDVHV